MSSFWLPDLTDADQAYVQAKRKEYERAFEVGEFATAIACIKQLVPFVRKDSRSHLAQDLHMLGNQANHLGDFLAARACYWAGLEIHQQENNKQAMAEILAFLAANETMRVEQGRETGEQFSDGYLAAIDALWDLMKQLEAETGQSASKEPLDDSIHEALQRILHELSLL